MERKEGKEISKRTKCARDRGRNQETKYMIEKENVREMDRGRTRKDNMAERLRFLRVVHVSSKSVWNKSDPNSRCSRAAVSPSTPTLEDN